MFVKSFFRFSIPSKAKKEVLCQHLLSRVGIFFFEKFLKGVRGKLFEKKVSPARSHHSIQTALDIGGVQNLMRLVAVGSSKELVVELLNRQVIL